MNYTDRLTIELDGYIYRNPIKIMLKPYNLTIEIPHRRKQRGPSSSS